MGPLEHTFIRDPQSITMEPWAQVSFGVVGGGRDAQVTGEAEHVVVTVAQVFQQRPRA
jgi:hypothetical protein